MEFRSPEIHWPCWGQENVDSLRLLLDLRELRVNGAQTRIPRQDDGSVEVRGKGGLSWPGLQLLSQESGIDIFSFDTITATVTNTAQQTIGVSDVKSAPSHHETSGPQDPIGSSHNGQENPSTAAESIAARARFWDNFGLKGAGGEHQMASR